MATGNDLPKSPGSPTTKTPQQTLQQALEKKAEIDLGFHGLALQQFQSTMAWEVAQLANDPATLVPADPEGAEAMGNMHIGDVVYNAPQTSASPAAQEAATRPDDQVKAAAKKGLIATLAPALIALGVGSPIAAALSAVGTYLLTRPPAAQVVETPQVTDTARGVGVRVENPPD